MADDYAFLDANSEHRSRLGDTSYLNPEFAARLSTAIRQAQAAGLPIKVMSGFRTGDVTGSAYDMSGKSSHGYGLAADVDGLDGPNGRITKAWQAIAEQNGLHNPYGIGNTKEFNHWQLPEKPLEQTPDLLNKLKAAYATGNVQNAWKVYSDYAPTTERTGYLQQKDAATGAAAAKPSFYDALANIESNNRNIFSEVDKDYPNQPGSRSQGYFQIDTPTWQQFAAKAGIDITKYPTAMNAPRDVQMAVVAGIPLSRFGERTQRMLGDQFGKLDTSKTIGELAGATSTTAPAPSTTTPSSETQTAAATPGPPSSVGDAIKKLTQPDDKGGTPLDKLAGAFSPGQRQQIQSGGQMLAPQPDESGMLAAPSQQLLAQVMASQTPLSWSTSPFGAGTAGPQAGGQMALAQASQLGQRQPGLTLNSLQPFGYG